jgi:glycosyltransferase involved in cell wall biosynthesis
MSLRVCFVGLTAGPVLLERWSEATAGGAELQQVLLARELARRGHDVSFVVQHPDIPRESQVAGLRVYCMRPARTFAGLNAALKTVRLWRVIRKIRPQVIYQRMAEWTTGLSAAAAQSLGAVFVHAVASDREISSPRGMVGNRFQRLMHAWGLRRAALILAQHEGQVRDLTQNFGLSARIFPSVYDPAPAANAPVRRGVHWIGTIRANKRPQLLLEAARRLPEVPFVMIGGPPRGAGGAAYYAQLADEARSLPNVEFAGFLTPREIDDRLGRAALLVNTSEYEGLPVTFLQAWRQAVPTIGFASAGRSAILDRCGWGVGSLDELVGLLGRLTRNPSELHGRGVHAREYFQAHHAVDSVVPRFESLLADLWATRLSRSSATPMEREQPV